MTSAHHSLADRRARLRERAADDRGYTLTELLVAMGLLSIFMGIFTTIMYMMTNGANRIERQTNAVTQVNQAFLALDKSVRYASAIMPPAVSSSGTWNVEYDTNIFVNGAATDTCTQLRVYVAGTGTGTNQMLQMRTWSVTSNGYAGLSKWRTLSNNVTNGRAAAKSADTPFVIPAAGTGAASQFQQLTVTVVAASDNRPTGDTNRATVTFSAVNSTAGTTNSVCQQVAVDSTS